MGLFDRLLGKKPPSAPATALDTSEANLRAVLGTDNVKIAAGLAIARVSTVERDAQGRDQVGGVPANIGQESWPRCTTCGCPMTFIAQIAAGPDEEPRYPERGSVALFLCNSEPPAGDDLCPTYDGPGSACFFVGEGQRAATPMFSDAQLREIVRAQQRNAEADAAAVRAYLMPEHNGRRARPVLDCAYRAERRSVVTCQLPEAQPASGGRHRRPTDDAYALWAAALEAAGVAIDIGSFPDWVQAPIDDLVCTCGAPMELIVQYEAFDDAINLGDAGRAYVFACVKRCSPAAFTTRWQCC